MNRLSKKIIITLVVFLFFSILNVFRSNVSAHTDAGWPCSLCPGGGPYTCPGGTSDMCLKIGCTSFTDSDGELHQHWSNNYWSQCGPASPPPPPPPPGPPPPAGACPGGACFGGIANCGAVGRSSGSGSCGAGELCCLDPGPPPAADPECTINSFAPNPLYQGINEVVAAGISYVGNREGTTFISLDTSTYFFTDDTTAPLGERIAGNFNAVGRNRANLLPLALDSAVAGDLDVRIVCRASNDDGDTANNLRTFNLTVLPVPSWFQVLGGGDVIVEGGIDSKIPQSCTDDETAGGTCRDEFIVEDTDSLKPGLLLYQGTTDFKLTAASGGNANRGGLAGPSWTSIAPYTPVLYNYDYFEALSSGKTFVNTSGSINTGTINGATADADGYVWIKNVGDLQISSPLNLAGTKAIIFVQDGDLIIDSEIRLNNTATGFIMFVVGDDGTGTKGNIIIDPSVGNNNMASTTPNITGVYWADGQISTGTVGPQSDARKLIMYGSFAAQRGFNLQRSLPSSDNLVNPAEVFQYAPEFQLNFPQTLSSKRLIWREVAP